MTMDTTMLMIMRLLKDDQYLDNDTTKGYNIQPW